MCFYDGDGEPVAASTFTVRRARRAYRCDECGSAIKPGDHYERASWLYAHGRGWSAMAICAGCYFVRHLIHQAELAEGCHEYESWPPYGNLSEDWSDGEYSVRLGLHMVGGELRLESGMSEEELENSEAPRLGDIVAAGLLSKTNPRGAE